MPKIITTVISAVYGALQIKPNTHPSNLVSFIVLGPRNGYKGSVAIDLDVLREGLAHAGIIERE